MEKSANISEDPPPQYPYNPNPNLIPSTGVPNTGFQIPQPYPSGGGAPVPPHLSGDISLAMNLSSNIAGNGRTPVFTVCPHCRSQITSRIETSRNGQVEATVQCQKKFIIISCLLFFLLEMGGFFGVIIYYGEWSLIWVCFIHLPVLGICFCRLKANQEALDTTCTDMAHFCPNCGQKLGISDGYEAYTGLLSRGRGYRNY